MKNIKNDMTLSVKIKLYASIGWGALVLFSLVGAFMREPAAPYVLCVGVIMWGAMKIINEAYASIYVLRALKTLENSKKEVEDQEDKNDD